VLSVKDVRSQGGGGLSTVQCEHFTDKGGSSDEDVCTFLCKNLWIFWNL